MEILLFIAALLIISPFLGRYCYEVYSGRVTFLSPYLSWIERLLYQAAGIDPEEQMSWKQYLKVLMIFELCGILVLFLIQIGQGLLPWNAQRFSGVPALVAFNTAIGYITNTDWQSYAGETTMSNFTQMAGLTVQNFLSAGTGMAVGVALMRGMTIREAATIGNYWVDLTRSVLYILLPMSIVLALLLVSQGVVQTLKPDVQAMTLEGEKQIIPLGPVASQVAIKQLGTNGGGFYHANSAHPFENPTRTSNFLESLSMMLLIASFPFTFGWMAKSKRRGWLLFFVILIIWGMTLFTARYTENIANPILGSRSWLEGKEQRLGLMRSILWFDITTLTSNGSINAVLENMKPLSGGLALYNMMHWLGGVGVGFCALLMYCLLAAFLGGMIAGRTPKFIAKTIEKRQLQWVFLALVFPVFLTLFGSALTTLLSKNIELFSNTGPHALTQLVYVFTSTAVNNGSAFSSIQQIGNYYNIVLSLTMMLGRLGIIIPSLALAGSMAGKKSIAVNRVQTIYTDSASFAILLICVIHVSNLLSFLPVLFLGPILEHLLMMRGVAF